MANNYILKKYLNNKGLLCPFCESPNITTGIPSTDTMAAWAVMSCNQCHAEWNDVYNLTHMEVISRPTEPVARKTHSPIEV